MFTSSLLPLVSVIIPTYNRRFLLQKAIESAQKQIGRDELFHLEIIIVDDGSTDQTGEYLESIR